MRSFLLVFLLFNFIMASDNLKEAIKMVKEKKDYEKAYILLKKSDTKNLETLYTLGKFYLIKENPYYDEIEGFNTILEAANKNYSKAQLFIGKLFLQGKIVNKDYEKAMYYFKEASKQRLYKANCYIAYMYARGMGVFPNFGRAHIFAKNEYKRGNKLCRKVWKDYNLGKYPKDKGFKIGDYLKPLK